MWGYHYWPWYLIGASGFFLIPELFALLTGHASDTLSDYSWHELNVTRAFEFTQHSIAWYSSFAAWIAFVVVITLHIWFRAG